MSKLIEKSEDYFIVGTFLEQTPGSFKHTKLIKQEDRLLFLWQDMPDVLIEYKGIFNRFFNKLKGLFR